MPQDYLNEDSNKIKDAILSARAKTALFSEKTRDAVHTIADLPWSIPENIKKFVKKADNQFESFQKQQDIRMMTPGEKLASGYSLNGGKAFRWPAFPSEEELINRNEIIKKPDDTNRKKWDIFDKAPTYEASMEKALKQEVRRDYRWNPDFYDFIENTKIHDISPIYEPALGLARDRSTRKIGGTYRTNVDEIATVTLLSSTTAHELLHKMFRYGFTPAAVDPVGFNLAWDRFLDKVAPLQLIEEDEYWGEFEDGSSRPRRNTPLWERALSKTVDKEEAMLANMMITIDTIIKRNNLYTGLIREDGAVLDDYRAANERFASFGDVIGREDFDLATPEDLFRYYAPIFGRQKSPAAPFKSAYQQMENKRYNEMLKKMGNY